MDLVTLLSFGSWNFNCLDNDFQMTNICVSRIFFCSVPKRVDFAHFPSTDPLIWKKLYFLLHLHIFFGRQNISFISVSILILILNYYKSHWMWSNFCVNQDFMTNEQTKKKQCFLRTPWYICWSSVSFNILGNASRQHANTNNKTQ